MDLTNLVLLRAQVVIKQMPSFIFKNDLNEAVCRFGGITPKTDAKHIYLQNKDIENLTESYSRLVGCHISDFIIELEGVNYNDVFIPSKFAEGLGELHTGSRCRFNVVSRKPIVFQNGERVLSFGDLIYNVRLEDIDFSDREILLVDDPQIINNWNYVYDKMPSVTHNALVIHINDHPNFLSSAPILLKNNVIHTYFDYSISGMAFNHALSKHMSIKSIIPKNPSAMLWINDHDDYLSTIHNKNLDGDQLIRELELSLKASKMLLVDGPGLVVA
ncbi:hypothetical protein [Photobacterium leiognathi]|uniref:hypothetical protein n=1 Tax=Photobacterium leiognathi TaxID=553611 RepID=UPI002980CFAC|nr:hypothetical protein [Photobacterium leiognathi]